MSTTTTDIHDPRDEIGFDNLTVAQRWLRPERDPVPTPPEADTLRVYGHQWGALRSVTITAPDDEESFSPAEVAAVLPVIRVYDAHLVVTADGAPAYVLMDGDDSEASR